MSTLDTLLGISDCELVKTENLTENGKPFKKIYLKYSGETIAVCPNCGGKMRGHGKRNLEVLDTPLAGYPTVLNIEFPRKRCADCNNLWQPTVENIDERRKMTNRAFIDITQRGLRNTFEDVCNDYVLAANTAKNIFVDFLTENKERLRFKTPSFLGIDEIKIKKIGEITVVTDLEHRTLFEMLDGRNQGDLLTYFSNLPDLDKILWVCTDMYRPFERVIASLMPNATWVIDHFHVVMKANEAVDAVRRDVQSTLTKRERIQTKKGLAYTLKTRRRDLELEEAEKIRLCRTSEKHKSLAIAFDLKEAFFEIYDNNPTSKENAQKAFKEWEESIPEDDIYEKFRELAGTVHNFYTQIFAYWDCPIAISNGYTECSNRLIRENNIRGRGYSFEILRGRSLYRKTNLLRAIEAGTALIGPAIPEYAPVFRFDSTKEEYEEDGEDENYEPFPEHEFDERTGELIE